MAEHRRDKDDASDQRSAWWLEVDATPRFHPGAKYRDLFSGILLAGGAGSWDCPPGRCSAVPSHHRWTARGLSLLRVDRVFRLADRAAMPSASLCHADGADELGA